MFHRARFLYDMEARRSAPIAGWLRQLPSELLCPVLSSAGPPAGGHHWPKSESNSPAVCQKPPARIFFLQTLNIGSNGHRSALDGQLSLHFTDGLPPHEHPVVLPQVSHFMQVPFRTSVKLPHSEHISPS